MPIAIPPFKFKIFTLILIFFVMRELKKIGTLPDLQL